MSSPAERSPYKTQNFEMTKLEDYWLKLNKELKECYARLKRIEAGLNKQMEGQQGATKGRNYF